MKPVCLLCTFVLSVALTARPQTSPSPAKKTTTQKKKPAAKTKSLSKTSASTKKGSSKPGRKPAPPAATRRGQLTPTADRYREIQQALADRGYLKNEPNGVWDQQSSEALKQFQTENHLSPTGKLSSLSLIQLGLGPRHDSFVLPIAGTGPVATPPEPEPEPLPPPPLPAN